MGSTSSPDLPRHSEFAGPGQTPTLLLSLSMRSVYSPNLDSWMGWYGENRSARANEGSRPQSLPNRWSSTLVHQHGRKDPASAHPVVPRKGSLVLSPREVRPSRLSRGHLGWTTDDRMDGGSEWRLRPSVSPGLECAPPHGRQSVLVLRSILADAMTTRHSTVPSPRAH
jgi:hypothetical protein